MYGCVWSEDNFVEWFLPLSRGDETHKTCNIGDRQFYTLSRLAGSLLQFKDSLIFVCVYTSDVCVSVCMRAASRGRWRS